jgi:IS5 family transposase
VQGREDVQRELLDVESLAGHLLVKGSFFAFLAEHRSRLFPDEAFEDLFPTGRGRPSVPASVIASVLVLQTLHNVSDREAVEALTFDLRWKAACGFAIDQAAFHPSTLTYWRKRLAGSKRPERIFEAVAQVVAGSGVLAGKRRRAVDSTVLDDAVARQDTVTQLIAQVRRVSRVVPGAGEVAARVCTRLTVLTGQGYEQVGKPAIAWDDTDAREALVSALVGDALDLLAGLDIEAIAAAGGSAADAVALLALVAGQDVEPAPGSDGTDGRWRIARQVAPERVISTVDPEARHAHKTVARRQDGFKAHIVIEPETGLSTAVALTKAAGSPNSDSAVGAQLLAADTTISAVGAAGDTPVQVLGDSAYGTGAMLDALSKAGLEAMVKPWPLKPAIDGGLSIEDFIADEDAGTLTCPNGVTRPISRTRTVTFGAACAHCPLRTICTTSAAGRKVKLHEHDGLQRAHRQRAAEPAFQATYRRYRPMVERSIAWLTRGARRVPYRGVEKNNAWLHHRTAGLNLRRLLNLGLTWGPGGWAIA